MKTQLDFIYDNEKARPDDVWLTQPMGGTVRELTWRETVDEARRVAAYLVSLDLPKPSQIALFSKNTAFWFIADMAIWMAGHVSVPLYPTLAPETIRQIIDHSEARLIFVGKLDGFAAMKEGIPEGLPRIAMPLAPPMDAVRWETIVRDTPPIEGSPTRDADDLATIMYTSGSTGTAKGVMHSFRTMSGAFVFSDALGITRHDRVLSYLPLAHALERAVIETVAMKVGPRVFFADSLDTFVQDLRRARPTFFVSVPRLWSKFQQGVFAKMPPKKLNLLLKIPVVRGIIQKKVLDGLGLADVRFAGSGSAPIPAELIAWYRSLGLELLEGYAMTENFSVSHLTRPGEVRVGYVGRPQDGVEQRITEEGEIHVKSPGTMLGYFKEKGLTDEVLGADGFIRTGDRGELDEKGRLKITGRVKELFKTSKGKYVAPMPIENALMLHDDVELALVSGVAMPQPFGMVLLSDAARARVADATARAALTRSLEAHLERTNATLDPHEHLEKLVVVGDSWTIDNGMLTPTMKVRRAAIEARYGDKVDGWYKTRERVLWS